MQHSLLPEAPAAELSLTPPVVDHVAVARLYGEPLFAMPHDLYDLDEERQDTHEDTTIYLD